MKVHLTVLGQDLSPSLRTLVEQHFRFAAGPFRSAVQAIHVKLYDAGHTGTGAVKHCEAQLHLRDGRTMKVQRQDGRAEYAVQRVAQRINRSLRGLRNRRREKAGL
jgi:ribosome-associated translation inhibitor RaiA